MVAYVHWKHGETFKSYISEHMEQHMDKDNWYKNLLLLTIKFKMSCVMVAILYVNTLRLIFLVKYIKSLFDIKYLADI